MLDTKVTFLEKEYKVDILGQITDLTNDKKIEAHTFKETTAIIILEDKQGNKVKVNYGLFILYAFKRFNLPIHLWKKADVGFLSNNESDYSLGNLFVRYPDGPIEHEGIKGFYYIPGWELNVINREGVTYRVKEAKLVKYEICDIRASMYFSYPVTVVAKNEGGYTDKVTHRLIAKTFLSMNVKYPPLVVNHIDGVKTNMTLSNLEWVTTRENNIHANEAGLRTDNKVVLIKDMVTGEVKEYFSLTEASRQMDCPVASLSSVLTKLTRVYRKRYLVKMKDDPVTWEELESATEEIRPTTPITIRHVITGEIRNFKSIKSAVRQTGIQQAAISRQLMREVDDRDIIKGYEIKATDDDRPWKVFSEYEIGVYERGMEPNTAVYLITDLIDDEKHVVYGWRAAARMMGVVKRTVIVVARDGGVIKGRFHIVKVK